jgi:hypothetical protein
MNSLRSAPSEPGKMGSKILCLNETNRTKANETMSRQSHCDRECKQRPRNRRGTFARIRAAIAGAKGKFEQKRFCPRFGTWKRKSCGNVNHEQIRILFGFVDIMRLKAWKI